MFDRERNNESIESNGEKYFFVDNKDSTFGKCGRFC